MQSLEAAGLVGPVHEVFVVTSRVALLPLSKTLGDLPSRPTALQVCFRLMQHIYASQVAALGGLERNAPNLALLCFFETCMHIAVLAVECVHNHSWAIAMNFRCKALKMR